MIVRQTRMGVVLHYLICGNGSSLRASDVKIHTQIFYHGTKFKIPKYISKAQPTESKQKQENYLDNSNHLLFIGFNGYK